MKILILSLLVLSTLSSEARAQMILVSDVDDTIKVSHVLDKDSTVANFPMLRNVFTGMPELYNLIVKHPELTTAKYLSNSPQKLIGDRHEKFLKINNFPKGDLVGRKWSMIFSGKNHKINSLRKFVKEFAPREMILIGDNGEADTEVYSQIRKEFPQIGGLTYIHQVYSLEGFHNKKGKPLEENQIGFATSLDIALDLLNRGYLKQEDVEELFIKVAPSILAEGNFEERGHAMAFPAWLDCRDFKVAELPTFQSQEAQDLLLQYGQKTKSRCEHVPYKN
ncbi:MAG: DUF2183 domain-containing protein [Bacteriovoracaceae bacterium]|nr:DUF2183 domain-containing protein [Bacteriovoracaceae bacterium]